MEEKVKEEVKEQTVLSISSPVSRLDYYYSIAKFFFIIFLVAGAGVLLINQALEYRYRAEFLKAPCKLCTDLNPEVKDCFISKRHVYPGLLGDWVDPTDNKCYGLDNKEVACKGNHNLNTTLNLSSFIIP